MKNWIFGLLIAAVAIGSVDASSMFEKPLVTVNAVTSEIKIEDSFVQTKRSSSGGFSSRPSSSKSSSTPKVSPSRSNTGSFGSGWGSSSSKPKVTPSKPSTSTPSPSSSGWFKSSSSKPSTVKQNVNKTATSVDSKVNASSKSSGKSFSTKESAISSFKAANAKETEKGGKFTAKYDSQPVSRPQHIPTTTTIGNTTVNVSYNQQYGGYGYIHPTLGTWIMYDMMSDAAMMSAMSSHHGYSHHGGGNINFSPVFTGVVIVGIICLFILIGVSNGKA